MKLITELNENVNCIVEESGDKKRMFIEGVFIQTRRANKNKRIYDKSIMEREVTRYNKELVEKNRAYGELGHPNGPSINLDRVSHLIKSLHFEGDDVIGRAEIVDTPMGQIVKSLIEAGANLGVSTRGLGSTKLNRDGISEVQDDFYLATAADIVADPSAPDAFVHGIMEGVEWVWDNGIIKPQQVEEIRNNLHKASKNNLQEAKLQAFQQFMQGLSQR